MEVKRLIAMVEETSRLYAGGVGGGVGGRAEAGINSRPDPRVDAILKEVGAMKGELSALAQAVRSLSETMRQE